MTRVPRVAQVDQELDLRDQFLDDFDLLGHQVSVDGGEPGEVASRSGETVGDSDLGPLADGGEHHGYGDVRALESERTWCAIGDDEMKIRLGQLHCPRV